MSKEKKTPEQLEKNLVAIINESRTQFISAINTYLTRGDFDTALKTINDANKQDAKLDEINTKKNEKLKLGLEKNFDVAKIGLLSILAEKEGYKDTAKDLAKKLNLDYSTNHQVEQKTEQTALKELLIAAGTHRGALNSGKVSNKTNAMGKIDKFLKHHENEGLLQEIRGALEAKSTNPSELDEKHQPYLEQLKDKYEDPVLKKANELIKQTNKQFNLNITKPDYNNELVLKEGPNNLQKEINAENTAAKQEPSIASNTTTSKVQEARDPQESQASISINLNNNEQNLVRNQNKAQLKEIKVEVTNQVAQENQAMNDLAKTFVNNVIKKASATVNASDEKDANANLNDNTLAKNNDNTTNVKLDSSRLQDKSTNVIITSPSKKNLVQERVKMYEQHFQEQAQKTSPNSEANKQSSSEIPVASNPQDTKNKASNDFDFSDIRLKTQEEIDAKNKALSSKQNEVLSTNIQLNNLDTTNQYKEKITDLFGPNLIDSSSKIDTHNTQPHDIKQPKTMEEKKANAFGPNLSNNPNLSGEEASDFININQPTHRPRSQSVNIPTAPKDVADNKIQDQAVPSQNIRSDEPSARTSEQKQIAPVSERDDDEIRKNIEALNRLAKSLAASLFDKSEKTELFNKLQDTPDSQIGKFFAEENVWDKLKDEDKKELKEQLSGLYKEFYSELHDPKRGFSDIKWPQPDAKGEKTLALNVDGHDVKLKETTKKATVDGKEITFRNVDLAIEQPLPGKLDLSLAVLDENGNRISKDNAVYFTAHYDKNGKLAEMSMPQPIKFTSADKESPITIEHDGKTYTLPINRGQYERMEQEIAKNKGISQEQNLNKEAPDLVVGPSQKHDSHELNRNTTTPALAQEKQNAKTTNEETNKHVDSMIKTLTQPPKPKILAQTENSNTKNSRVNVPEKSSATNGQNKQQNHKEESRPRSNSAPTSLVRKNPQIRIG
jgi:hypothetical protein